MPEGTYLTGLCASSKAEVQHSLKRWGSLTGAGFRLEFKLLHTYDPDHIAYIRETPPRLRDAIQPPEIRIRAHSQHRADQAALLLYAAHAVIEGCIPISFAIGWSPYVAYPLIREAHNSEDAPSRIQTDSFTDVAGLAVRLSRRKVLTEAAFSFLASVYLFSLHPMELNPSWGSPIQPREPSPMNRAWEAQRLFSAYQIVEGLGLTVVGATGKRPSVINKIWDKEIRLDLEARLARIGIDPEARFIWSARGSGTKAYRKLQSRTSESMAASWNRGHIRDEEIPFVDAINRANWLRSNITAHRSSAGLDGLHPLDTHNVQLLARMLLLHAAKFPFWSNR